MIPLGSIPIRHRISVNEARKKILTAVEMLTGDAIVATQLATAVSSMARSLYQGGTEPCIGVEIDTHGHQPAFVLTFEDQQPPPVDNGLNVFFSEVRHLRWKDGRHAVRAVARVDVPRALTDDTIAQLKFVIGQKNRDELMAEVQEKNRELEESLENLRRTTSAKERMESELNVGRDIQMSMLPLNFPAFPDREEFDIYAALQPAREVGGDFYDFFFVDEDWLCFCVGDVSGKGVPAALFMAVTKTLIKSKSTQGLGPGVVLNRVNDDLALDNASSMFVTLFIGTLNVRTGELIYANAGHNPPYVKHLDGGIKRLDARHGPVVGAMEGMEYGEDRLRLNGGDLLLVYTDGVTEAMNASQELFGEKRLADMLTSYPYESVEDVVQATVGTVELFEDGADRADDVTVLCIQRLGSPSEAADRLLELAVKNDLAEIDRVNQAFNDFAEESDIPQAVSFKMNMVFDELLNNIISYAYSDDAAHEIDIRITLADGRLTVTIEDDGAPFDPFDDAETPDTEASLDDRQMGGLGVHLVRNVMDEVAYERRDDRNVVTLVKHL